MLCRPIPRILLPWSSIVVNKKSIGELIGETEQYFRIVSDYANSEGLPRIINNGEMSVRSYTHFTTIYKHFTIINKHFTIISLK